MENKISETSSLYKELLKTYDRYIDRECFDKCYDIVDKSTYKDIHYLITKLKQFENADINLAPNNDTIKSAANLLVSLFNSQYFSRNAFFMDILEEARDRKRPNN